MIDYIIHFLPFVLVICIE